MFLRLEACTKSGLDQKKMHSNQGTRGAKTVTRENIKYLMKKIFEAQIVVCLLIIFFVISAQAAVSRKEVELKQRKNVLTGLKELALPDFLEKAVIAANSYETENYGLVIVGKTNLPAGSTIYCFLTNVIPGKYSQLLSTEVKANGYFETDEFNSKDGLESGDYYCRITSRLSIMEEKFVKKILGGDLGINLKGDGIIEKKGLGRYKEMQFLITMQRDEYKSPTVAQHKSENNNNNTKQLNISQSERDEAISAINKFIADGLIFKVENPANNYVEIYVSNKFYALPFDFKEGLCIYPFKAYCKDPMCIVDIIDGYSTIPGRSKLTARK